MEFKYSLTGHGWAEGFIKINSLEYEFVASDLTKPLEDMLNAIINLIPSLVLAHQCLDSTSFVWEEEPACTEWRMKLLKEDTLQLKVLYCEDSLNPEFNTIIDEPCNLMDFISAIIKELDNILDNYGVLGFKQTWGTHEFPISGYLKLKSFLLGNIASLTADPNKANRRGIYKSNFKNELDILKLRIR